MSLATVAERVTDRTEIPAEVENGTASFPVGYQTAVEVTQQTADPACFDVMILSWDRTGGISAEAEKGSARGARAAASLAVQVIEEYQAEEARLEAVLAEAYGEGE